MGSTVGAEVTGAGVVVGVSSVDRLKLSVDTGSGGVTVSVVRGVELIAGSGAVVCGSAVTNGADALATGSGVIAGLCVC